MSLSNQEHENKLRARILLDLPSTEHPENTVFVTPRTRLESARYRVVLGSRVVCFQSQSNSLVYLGEYHLDSFPDLVEYFTDLADAVYCQSCRERVYCWPETPDGFRYCAQCMVEIEGASAAPDPSTPDTCGGCGEFITLDMASEGEMTDLGFRCSKCLHRCVHCEAYCPLSAGLIFEDKSFVCFGCQAHLDIISPVETVEPDANPGPDLDTCGRCRTFMLASNGEQTTNGFRCSDCLEVARKFEDLSAAIAIVQAAVREAYPAINDEAFIVHISSSGFVNITKHSTLNFDEGVPVGGFADAEGLASDFLHRIRNHKQ